MGNKCKGICYSNEDVVERNIVGDLNIDKMEEVMAGVTGKKNLDFGYNNVIVDMKKIDGVSFFETICNLV